jgi:hypothetical protein
MSMIVGIGSLDPEGLKWFLQNTKVGLKLEVRNNQIIMGTWHFS